MHTFTPITTIEIPPSRQRQHFEETSLLELAQSIEKNGLFHALQVRQDGRTLVSGERRLRAIILHLEVLGKTFTYAGLAVPKGCVPTIPVSTGDPLSLEEIELDENFRRKDLTWQEHAAATARLHSLRQAQRNQAIEDGAYFLRTPEDAGLQTTRDTAEEIHGEGFNNNAQDEVRKEILIASHMDKPEVAKAANLKDAFKALKRIEEADRNRALAIAVGSTHTSGVHKVYHAECTAWMLDPQWHERFDVILTDPPYGMNAQDFGDGAGRLAQIDHQYDDSLDSWVSLMKRWSVLAYTCAKPQAHAYVWCDIDNFHKLKGYMEAAGWYVFRTPLTNYKQNSGRVPLPDKGPRRQSEWCLYAIKGGKLVNYIASDVIVTGSDENLTHGAQKPVALFDDLLRRSIRPGDWVLDTFAGTGTIIPAAHALKCVAVAVEQNPEYYGICLQRLANLDKQLELA